MYASLIGFAVGALFGPEAYHFFPYFAVAYTSAMVAVVKQLDTETAPEAALGGPMRRMARTYKTNGKRQLAVHGSALNWPQYFDASLAGTH